MPTWIPRRGVEQQQLQRVCHKDAVDNPPATDHARRLIDRQALRTLMIHRARAAERTAKPHRSSTDAWTATWCWWHEPTTMRGSSGRCARTDESTKRPIDLFARYSDDFRRRLLLCDAFPGSAQ
jgi:hypothetical protein